MKDRKEDKLQWQRMAEGKKREVYRETVTFFFHVFVVIGPPPARFFVLNTVPTFCHCHLKSYIFLVTPFCTVKV